MMGPDRGAFREETPDFSDFNVWVEIVGFPSVLIFWLSQPGVGVSFESRKGSLALLMAPDPACYRSPAGVIECELSQTLSLRRV